jgi:hypothetical protein
MNKTKKIKYCQLPETYNINGSSVHLYHIPNNTLHVSAMVIGGKFKIKTVCQDIDLISKINPKIFNNLMREIFNFNTMFITYQSSRKIY